MEIPTHDDWCLMEYEPPLCEICSEYPPAYTLREFGEDLDICEECSEDFQKYVGRNP